MTFDGRTHCPDCGETRGECQDKSEHKGSCWRWQDEEKMVRLASFLESWGVTASDA